MSKVFSCSHFLFVEISNSSRVSHAAAPWFNAIYQKVVFVHHNSVVALRGLLKFVLKQNSGLHNVNDSSCFLPAIQSSLLSVECKRKGTKLTKCIWRYMAQQIKWVPAKVFVFFSKNLPPCVTVTPLREFCTNSFHKNFIYNLLKQRHKRALQE